MKDASYKSKIRGMLIHLLGKQDVYGWGEAPGDPKIEHALDVMTDNQAGKMYAICMRYDRPAAEEFIKELQHYQIRKEGDTHE